MVKEESLLYEKFHILLSSKTKDYHVRMIVVTALHDLEADKLDFLNQKDIRYINRVRGISHKQDIILGRFAAKEAVAGLREINRKNIEINKGVFNQPIVVGDCLANTQVTVSHSGNYGIALAYPEDLVIGVDMEKNIEGEKANGIFVSEYEKRKIEELSLDRTFLWSVREALIKCLKTNLFYSTKLMEVCNIERKGKEIEGTFKHFPQYRFMAFSYPDRVIAVVIPQNMNLSLLK